MAGAADGGMADGGMADGRLADGGMADGGLADAGALSEPRTQSLRVPPLDRESSPPPSPQPPVGPLEGARPPVGMDASGDTTGVGATDVAGRGDGGFGRGEATAGARDIFSMPAGSGVRDALREAMSARVASSDNSPCVKRWLSGGR